MVSIDKTKSTHPSFVEILKQLLGKEAEILKVVLQATSEIIYLPLVDIKLIDKEKGTYIKVYRNLINLYDSETNAYYVNDELPSFIDNWVRLGLVVISTNNESLSDKSDYEKFNDHPVFKKLKSNYLQSNPEKSLKLAEGFLEITDFGRSFAKAISVI